MWILHIFKDAFNSTFDYLIQKVKGRFLAFAIQLVLSYLAVAVFTLLISVSIFPLFNQGEFPLDLFSVEGLFTWARMVDPAWSVTLVIAVNFLFHSTTENKRMSFPDFYLKKSSLFWLDLVIAVSVIAAILTVYYKNELMLSFPGLTPFDLLLAEGGDNLDYTLLKVLSNWIYYIVFSLPIIALVIIEIRERKRNGMKLVLPLWKIFVSTVLLSFMLAWMFDDFLYVFSELVMTLLNAPFEMVEIPAIFGVIVSVLFKTIQFIVTAAVIHFVLEKGMEENEEALLDQNNINEL